MEKSKIVLPKKAVPAESKSPHLLIIFSKPKTGKTTLFSQLEDALILDLEKGTKHLDAVKIEVNSLEELKQVGEAIKAENKPYKYLIVDTVTALETMVIPFAESLYSKTSMGKNWFTKLKSEYGNILNLPNGAGYMYVRDAFMQIIDYIKTLAPRIILSAHVKDASIDKQTSEVNSLEIDLAGKLKRIISAESDAIGYLYRKGNQNILSFKTTDTIACGARPQHLRNKEIVISEETDKGIVSHWKNIYID
jgi:hypothetical protein